MKQLLSSRIIWSLACVSVALMALSLFLAFTLFQQQSEILQLQHDSIQGQREANGLEESLIDLSELLEAHVEGVTSLHQRIELHLSQLRKSVVDSDSDATLQRVEASYLNYRRTFDGVPPIGAAEHQEAMSDALRILHEETLPLCRQLQDGTDQHLDRIGNKHASTLRELAIGIGGVGVIGSLAGMGFGFAVAMIWRQTMRQLEIHVRSASGKIDRDFPEVVVRSEGDPGSLDEQLAHLVTQIESILQKLQQRELEVLRAEQLAAVGQLAAGVAHEIRNPLTSIKLLVQAALQSGESNAITYDDLAILEREVLRMERSLKIFLDFARPIRLERRDIVISTLVEQTFALLRVRAEQQKVRLVCHQPVSESLRKVDPEQLRQVILNLVLNALDAMPDGGALSVVLNEEPNGVSVLRFHDSGCGISPAAFGRLFQPFFSSKETGLGLGLVISRRIVEDHGGELTAENQTSGGACFTVRLPSNSD